MDESIVGKRLNKGEWAELYVMLKLLGEGKLFSADKYLRKRLDSYLEILRVIREECDARVLEYVVDSEKSSVTVKSQDGNEIFAEIPMADFRRNALDLFNGIDGAVGRSVTAPESVCKFAGAICVGKPKAPAVKSLVRQFGGKNDIFIEVRDCQTSSVSVMGFSIKSKFGSCPTLFNAGSSSQFVYRIDGCNDALMNEFNSISGENGRGWSRCRAFLHEHRFIPVFVRTKNPVYGQNLMLIRESMSKILAWCVKDRLIDSTADHGVMETVGRMTAANPLEVPAPDIYYEKAVKDFLMAGFSGMTAARPWDGREQVNGGYIVVMEDGDVICYHSNDRESFRDYLYRNTYFEYVSSDKYSWSRIRKEDGAYFLDLNISVRFFPHTR